MASLKDIAEKTGVSIRTVNRALKNNGYVGDKTRERVLEAARELGYRPNLAARALKTGRSFEIGAVIGSMDELHMEKMAAFENTLRQAGYSLHVLFGPHGAPNASETHETMQTLIERRPAAAAIFPQAPLSLENAVEELEALNIPYIVLDAPVASRVDSIRVDRQQGVYESIHMLAARDRARVAFLGQGHPDAETRLPGYRRAIEELGLEPILLPIDPELGEFAAGAAAIDAYLARDPRPDAIQAHSDVMALGFLASLHRRGIRVPETVSVVGFDDRRIASLSWPLLTTVRQPNRAVGRKAAETLLAKIAGEEPPAAGWSQALATRVITRESA